MELIDNLWLALWAVCLLACLVLYLRIAHRKVGADGSTRRSLFTSGSIAVVGALLSIIATPDWNPFLMSAYFAPYWALAVFGIVYSRLAVTSLSRRKANVIGVLLALVSTVLAPVALLLVAALWIPAVLVISVAWGVSRVRRQAAQ